MKKSMAALALGVALVACGGSGGGGNPSIRGTYRGTIGGTVVLRLGDIHALVER